MIASPPFDFLARSFLPLLARMGANVKLELSSYGFYPRGGGEIRSHIVPAKRLAALELTERGAAVFNNWCSACHSRGPMNAPGTTSLQNKYQGSVPAALEDRKDLTVELVKLFVRNGVATMPQFRKTEVSDADLEALTAYLTRR